MKKQLLFLLLAVGLSNMAQGQSRGIKIGYIDMEYILQNVSDYAEAKNQLEQKAQGWKQEIETRQTEINTLRESLKTERVLLTKELIEEREQEIAFQEKELSDYQQKRFGPTGDMIMQKSILVKPIQDQVFTIAQDIAEANNYDFIFDKSSDLTMLFANKRYNISDRVIRMLSRASKRDQLTKKQLKEEEAKEYNEDLIDENPAMAERQKVLDERQAQREKLLADRKAAAEQKKKEFEERRARLLAEREAKKNGTAVPPTPGNAENTTEAGSEQPSEETVTEDPRAKAAAERAAILEERKKALDEKRKKILEEREAAKKAKADKLNENKTD